jgi:hypothetical protein
MSAFAKSGEFVRKLERLDDPAVTVPDLESMHCFITEAIADPAKARYRDRNIALCRTIDAELAQRRKRLSDAA